MKAFYKYLLLLILTLLFSGLFSLGYFIPLYPYFYIPIVVLSLLLLLIIILNLVSLVYLRNRYLALNKVLNLFKNKEESTIDNSKRLIVTTFIYLFLVFISLIVLGFLLGSILKINLAYLVLVILDGLILASLSINYFTFINKKITYPLDKKRLIFINDSLNTSSLEVLYLNKVNIKINIETLLFLKKEEIDLIYNINQSMFDNPSFKKLKQVARLNSFFQLISIDNNLITYFINTLFFKSINRLMALSNQSLNDNYQDKIFSFKKEYNLKNNTSLIYLNLINKLKALRLVNELSFEFNPYQNDVCLKDYYFKKGKYLEECFNSKKDKILLLLLNNQEIIKLKKAYQTDNLELDLSLNNENLKLIETFNQKYYDEHFKNYSKDHYLNYEFYKDIISRQDELTLDFEKGLLGYAYIKTNDIYKAKSIFIKLNEADDNNAFTCFNLGRIYIKDNQKEGITLLRKSYRINFNYLEASLKLIDEYNNRNKLLISKRKSNDEYVNLIKTKFDLLNHQELTPNSKIESINLDDQTLNMIINLAKKLPSILEIKGFCQFIGTYKIQYIGLYFDHKADETKKTIAFNLFYYLLDNLNLPSQENNFFLYRLIDSKKKYDVYSTFFNSNKSSLIYKKEEN